MVLITSVSGSRVGAADVTVAKVSTLDTAVAGGRVAWTVTVSNSGPSLARDVVVRDPAVAGLDGFTVRPPTGATCAAGVCAVGDLPPGPAAALSFAVEADVPATCGDDEVTQHRPSRHLDPRCRPHETDAVDSG